MCPHEFDVDICSITEKNAALSFSLVGQPCPRDYNVNFIIISFSQKQFQNEATNIFIFI